MDRDRSRVLALFVAYLGLAAVSLFVLDWFVAATPFGRMMIDLRNANVCPDDGPCASFALGEMRGTGFYAPLAGLTFYGTILFTLLVAYQAFARMTKNAANESLSKLGYLGGMILFGTAVAAGFVFGPEATSGEREMALEVSRTAAPFLILIALLVGITILYYATQQSEDAAQYKPLGNLPVRKATEPPVAPLTKTSSQPPASALQKTSSQPPASALEPRVQRKSDPIQALPEHLRKKLKFVTLSAELTRAGIDARLEDGASKLVMWRDVVGIVARRLPPEHDGATFLDVVSVAGSTLRVLPWTKLSGETFEGEGDAWMRAVLAAMVAKCPEASLDPATKRFQGGEPAAQLALAKLAVHDEKLA